MIKSNIISLFPTAVLGAKLDRVFTEEEFKFLEKVRNNTMPNVGNSTGLDNYILNNKELASLKSFFESQLVVYRDTIFRPKHDVSIYITQSWLNYSSPGEFHHRHKHPNSCISGVFYIDTNDSDRIFFDRDQYTQIEIHPGEFNDWNSNTWWLPATSGQLYLFPSSLTHYVGKVIGNKTRISLSFNTFVSGVLGDQNGLTEVKL
jgi:uncharacterized protein (TIGR02466 family)